MELQLPGISVSVLQPGAVRTGMLNASVRALEGFCEKTKLYPVHSRRFRKIVESVEAKNVPPEVIAKKALKLILSKKPAYVVKINRNPLLLMLNALPARLQTGIIRWILTK